MRFLPGSRIECPSFQSIHRTSNIMISKALCALLFLAGTTSAQAITKGFDDVSAPGPFKFIVPGFDNGPLLEYPEVTLDGGVILRDVLFGNSATTAPNIYATCDTCNLGDNPPSGLPGKISGIFPMNVSDIELDVYNGFGGSSGSFTLTAYDAGGAVVASDVKVAGPMGNPSFQQHLQVSGSGITSFEVTTNLALGYTFAIDTLVFTFEEIGTSGCTSSVNSSGSAAKISATGSSSVGSNNFHLAVNDLPANTFGLVFYGPNSIQVPFGDGFRCVGGSIFRLGVSNSGAGGVMQRTVDLTSPPTPAGQVTPGSTWYYQGWFRDIPAGGAGFNLSDNVGVSFTN